MASVDDAETNARFARELGLDFPVLSDPGGRVAKAYGVRGELGYAARVTFFIDSDGIVRGVDRAVDPATAGAEVARRLEALGFPRR